MGGLALTLTGILIGSTIIYFCMKRFGTGFASKFVDTNGFKKFRFLNDPAKRDSFIFLLFFIPGTPKDVLTYFAPLTGIPFGRFITIATLARIPSVVTSTLVGSSVSKGEFLKSLIVFAITGVVGIAGILINNKFTAAQEKKLAEKAAENQNAKDNDK
ncbi:MAG: TVP38/TMEM64 family protein [Eubacteriales bacterium]